MKYHEYPVLRGPNLINFTQNLQIKVKQVKNSVA